MRRPQVLLGPSDRVVSRPFTEPENTEDDADILRQTLALERRFAQQWVNEGRACGEMILRHEDDEGQRHLLAVPDLAALLGARDFTAVGFFGQAKQDVDHTVLFALEEELIASFPVYSRAGLLSYYDVELAPGRYGNLILFRTADVPPEWRESEIHNRAVALSPNHYHSVRLHKGTVDGPFLGDGHITIERTKYFGFDPDGIWRAVRSFAAARG
jgi:hypothetical protein